ncbi:hypothetical protein [Desulfovibrio sp. Huiquan2017]|uniref:hypothetical protein n=1 Tax=Desulfovibrio sp. Huiquan2017 TaxID=2816861 RepID=UPI001A92CBA2|nr:hypothetical protein [Desulfovibrio sp. Huiquan2017]
MQKIPINLAAPGMKLAKAVTKENGMTIMAEGMELTESLISRLEGMSIERITVQGHPVEMGGTGAGTHWGERRDRLDHLFRQYSGDRWMMRVKDRMRQYFQIKAAAQEAKMQAVKQMESEEDAPPENGGGDA